MLPAKLHVARIKGLRQSSSKRDVKDEGVRVSLVNELRARIVPWKLMKSQFTEFDGDLSISKVTEKLSLAAVHFGPLEPRDDSDCSLSDDAWSTARQVRINCCIASFSARESRRETRNVLKCLPSKLCRLKQVSARDALLQHSLFHAVNERNAQERANLGKLETKADVVVAIATDIANNTSNSGAASSMFRLLAMFASVGAMCAETNGGIGQLAQTLHWLMLLVGHILESAGHIFTSEGDCRYEQIQLRLLNVLQYSKRMRLRRSRWNSMLWSVM